MATASSIRAGVAYVELTVDNTLLMRGLKQAQEKLKAFSATVSSWGRSLAKVSAFAIEPPALSAHTFSEAASAMTRVRGITGATPDKMAARQAWKRLLESFPLPPLRGLAWRAGLAAP